jgi:hypothetical protein
MIIAARSPTGAPAGLEEAFRDCLAVLDGVRAQDVDEEEKGEEVILVPSYSRRLVLFFIQDFQVTEWASRSDGALDEPFDTILLRLAPTYEVPVSCMISSQSTGLIVFLQKSRSKKQGRADSSPAKSRPRVKKAQAAADVEMEGTDVESQVQSGEQHCRFHGRPHTETSHHSGAVERKVGDTYPPDALPDHRGPYFAHQQSKLVQRDYRDVDGELIAPHELYEKLTEGTLFSAQVTLHTYIFDAKPPQRRSKVRGPSLL